MRILLLFASVALAACTASPAPEANGYDVQLFFEGAPLGTSIPVGTPQQLTVHRIQQQTDRCTQAQGACDPTSETPIVLVSASCDSLCTVTGEQGEDGAVALRTVGQASGNTTLHVTVRSELDGSEWQDAYPLAFR